MIVLSDRRDGGDFAPNLWELSHLLHQWAEVEGKGRGKREECNVREEGSGIAAEERREKS